MLLTTAMGRGASVMAVRRPCELIPYDLGGRAWIIGRIAGKGRRGFDRQCSFISVTGGEDMQARAEGINRVLWQILFLNVIVASAKAAWGIVSGSTAMLADGIHSFTDGSGNIVALIAMKAATEAPRRGPPLRPSQVRVVRECGHRTDALLRGLEGGQRLRIRAHGVREERDSSEGRGHGHLLRGHDRDPRHQHLRRVVRDPSRKGTRQ